VGSLRHNRRVECLECLGKGTIDGIGERALQCWGCAGRGSFTFEHHGLGIRTQDDLDDDATARRLMRGRFEIQIGLGTTWEPWPAYEWEETR
jgi:DnaJ-class molecular chaperone